MDRKKRDLVLKKQGIDLAFFLSFFKKRGISTIVATVLIVLVTVASVTILWIGIDPLLSADVSVFDTRLSIVTVTGFTFFDAENKTVTVQVEAKGKDAADYAQIILTLDNGAELLSVFDAPLINGVSRYYLDVGVYVDKGVSPTHVSVAPIFVIDGRNILGVRGKSVVLPRRVETPEFYKNIPGPFDPTKLNVFNNIFGNNIPGLDKFVDGPEGFDPVVFIDVGGCQVLDSSDTTYTLINDILGHVGTCFTITADDITLDGNGFVISGDDVGSDYGVTTTGTRNNIMIKNFKNISSFDQGISFVSTNNSFIIDNTVIFNNDGIYISTSSNNILTNNNVSLNSFYGIVTSSSGNNTLTSNVVTSNGDNGVFLNLSSNNVLTSNTADGNANSGIYLKASSNNVLTSNTASGNDNIGVLLDLSSNNILINNIANSNSGGISLVSGSNDNSFSNDFVDSNNAFGIGIDSSFNNQIDAMLSCNNLGDDFICSSSMGNTGIGNIFGVNVSVCDDGWPFVANYTSCA